MGGKKEKLLRRMSVAQKEPWTPFESGYLPGFPNEEVYINSRYQVNVSRFIIEPPFGKCFHLSIKTRDKAPYHDWRDFQRIKNELVGPEYEAVELYPAETRLVDTSNQYHLWCFIEFKFPFGYKVREVCEEVGDSGAVQRPFEVKPPDAVAIKDLPQEPVRPYDAMYFGKKWD